MNEASSLSEFPRQIVGPKHRMGYRRTPLRFRAAARRMLERASNCAAEVEAEIAAHKLSVYDEVVWAMVRAALGNEKEPPNTRACEVLVRAVGEASAPAEAPEAFRVFILGVAGAQAAPPPIQAQLVGQDGKGGSPAAEKNGVEDELAGGLSEEAGDEEDEDA